MFACGLVFGRDVPDEALSLAGRWRVLLDRDDVGLTSGWQAGPLAEDATLMLPGSLQGQGFGDEITTKTPWVLSLYDRSYHLRRDYRAYTQAGNVKVPFICQPPRHYLGAAWLQREWMVPETWRGKHLWLKLERPRWKTTVWVDGKELGSAMSLVAPHEYEVGELSPGSHSITVRIDNRMLMPYRPDAHSVSDSLGSSWSGIAGALEVRARPRVWLERVELFPDVAARRLILKGKIGNRSKKAGGGLVRMTIQLGGGVALPSLKAERQIAWEADGGTWAADIALGQEARLWDEYEPVLHTVDMTLDADGVQDHWSGRFGLRDFRASGTDFTINGRKVHLRGTHHGGDFPLTGYPSTDPAYWRWLFGVCRKWGLNHVRFHSFCPPEAAFDAADDLGIYLQPEAGMWNEISPGTPMEKMMYEETDRMLRAYGNHPSFVLFSPSNEPKGRWKEALPRWVKHYSAADPRRLYTTGTGWSLIDEPGPVVGADFLAVHRIGLNMLRGKTAWFGRDYARSLRGVNVPVASHELGQWCAYPDFSVISKFNGYLRPGNYEIFRDSAAANGVLERNREFALASGKYQLACYKEDIEANLRTPGLGGFQLLDLHDYVGQGTALVGVLDPFWEEKGYVSAREWRRFCSETVPLARMERRVLTQEETLECSVEVAHWGRVPLENARATWRISDSSGKVLSRGEFSPKRVPLGAGTQLGRIVAPLSAITAPASCRFSVKIEGTEAENDWNFWVYPKKDTQAEGQGAQVTRSMSGALEALRRGERVVYVPRPADLSWSSPPLDGEPIFWNRLMSPGWGRMLGLWCDSKHPALARFPTESHCDWQWTEIVRGARAINLEGLPGTLAPIVQAIDDWNRNWKLGLIFEARVGAGRLLVCSIDIVRELESRPVARQLRASLLAYANSEAFDPQTRVDEAALARIGFDARIMEKLGVTAEASGQGVGAVIDGDPNTFWTIGGAARGQAPMPHPHALTLHFPRETQIEGVVLMNRQNDRDHLGDIRSFVLEGSSDGNAWTEIRRGELDSTWEPQTLTFARSVTVRHLRLTALSGFGADASAALAEIAVLYHGSPLPENDDRPLGTRRVRSTSSDVEETPPVGASQKRSQGADAPKGMKTKP